MLSRTPARRAGTLSIVLANGALYLAHWAGLQTPAAALLLSGCVFRCLTLPYTIYGDQCLRRAACAMPELQDAYKDYLSIADHPNAIVWEKRVAAQKLKNDRERIFRGYRTNNVKMTAPYAVAAAASLYCLGVPAQQMGAFFIQDAGRTITSPLAVSAVASAGHLAWVTSLSPTIATAAAGAASSSSSAIPATTVLFAIDPTLALAAGLTCFNVHQHLRQRMGFNDRLDRWIGHMRRAVLGSCVAVAAGSLLAGPVAYACAVPALQFFPPYLAPVWLGMALTTAFKTVLVNNTAPGRALFRLPDYPPPHGTYGEESTAAGHEYRLAFTGVDVEERRHVWQTQKRILDYECDLRIRRWLSRLGLFDDLDELAYEAELLRRKRAVARQRRLARESVSSSSASSAEGEQAGRSGSHTAGMTQAARRRHAMRHEASLSTQRCHNVDGSEGVADEATAALIDHIQEEDNKRRHDLKMLIRAWLQHFFAYEARNGGALPPHQLFPYNADADPCTGEASDASDRTAVAGTGSAENFPLSSLPAGPSAESEEDSAGGKRSASSSSPSTPAPPPPSSPPPSAAITTATKKTAKVRDVGCSAPAPGDPHEPPRFYSRYVFRRTVTGLQLLWGYFSFVVWNYLAHIRWYGASMVYLTTLVETEKSSAVALVVKERGAVTGSVAASNEDVQGELAFELHRLADQWLAVAYLAVALAGLIYTASAVLYVCVVNTPWHVRAAWPQPQLFTKACGARTGSTARDPHDSDAADPDNDPFLTYGSVLSRSSPFPPSSSTDVVPLSFTQPQFLFPLRRLTALDRVATASVRRSGLAVSPPRPPGQPYLSIQQQQQQQWHRGDPKAPLLWCACPLVVALVVFDFMVIHSCRVQGWPVRLLQGLTPALGLLLLLYTMKSVAVLCGRRCVVCWRALPIAVYTLTRPPTQPGYGPPGPWASQ